MLNKNQENSSDTHIREDVCKLRTILLTNRLELEKLKISTGLKLEPFHREMGLAYKVFSIILFTMGVAALFLVHITLTGRMTNYTTQFYMQGAFLLSMMVAFICFSSSFVTFYFGWLKA